MDKNVLNIMIAIVKIILVKIVNAFVKIFARWLDLYTRVKEDKGSIPAV